MRGPNFAKLSDIYEGKRIDLKKKRRKQKIIMKEKFRK
jgi:hypothetical protein